ncbi:unnamed protein product [Clonostachys byssicola]|uniref:F-box domain-containing protein n=1 Tax=Clonostachys byssicola TaxID=160290 RepID=A0A9N9Y6E9_9HYPO|nr:unnamed protein product [Clonostachys byssicola]
MLSNDPNSNVKLSADILYFVFSHTDRPTLRNCRLLSHSACSVATPSLFRRLRLSAAEGEAERFLQVAQNDSLRCHVREIIIDTNVGGDFEYRHNASYEIPAPFMKALPHLRFFSNLKALGVDFNEHCGGDDYEDRTWVAVEETHDFRYRVLQTIFESLAGTWTAERQLEIDEEANLDWDFDNANGEEDDEPDNSLMPAIPIKLLEVHNLEGFNDERLTTSEAFRAVIDSGTITCLKLYIVLEEHNDEVFKQHYDFFDTLQQTWLSPSLAANLKVLSLYCMDPWGWNPKMDFRTVNHSQGGFPKLETLTLGNYVLSHEWQIDWIINQGRESGGLKKLYLDQCSVLHKGNIPGPLPGPSTVLGQDAQGNDIEVSNDNYPRIDIMKRYNGEGTGMVEIVPELRWSHILQRFRESMHSLKIFDVMSQIEIEYDYDSEELYRHGVLDDSDPRFYSGRFSRREWEDVRLCYSECDGPFWNHDAGPNPTEDEYGPEDEEVLRQFLDEIVGRHGGERPSYI